MGELNSDDHYMYYGGQKYLARNGVTIIVNKRVQNAVLVQHHLLGSEIAQLELYHLQ